MFKNGEMSLDSKKGDFSFEIFQKHGKNPEKWEKSLKMGKVLGFLKKMEFFPIFP